MSKRQASDLEYLIPPKKKKRSAIRDLIVSSLRPNHYVKLVNKDDNVTRAGMMDEYYVQQSGTGIGGFAGMRYQKGDGFFGRMLTGAVLPLVKKVLPFLGKTAWNTGVEIARDVSQGQKFKESAKRRLRETASDLESRAMAKVRDITGSGRKRRRITANTFPKKKTNTKRRRKKSAARQKRTKGAGGRRKKKAIDFL